MTEPTPPAAAPAPVPAAPLTEAEDKQWASFAHFGGILWILPSLIIFLVFRDRGAKTKVESKEALNWQITWIAGYIILVIIFQIIGGIVISTANFDNIVALSGVVTLLGLIPGILWVINVILSIMGGIKVNGGGSYRYPFAIRLIK
jgi:uncharacterized Tic20 family protein